MDQRSADYTDTDMSASPSGASFSAGRAKRLVMNRRTGPWEGYRRQGRSPLSPSRLPLRAHFHRESDVWVRGSRYTLHMLVEWLVLDYSLSVRYLDTKNVHIKVFISDSILKIVSNYSASSSEFVIAFVSWNAGKVPDFFTSNWRHERAADFEVSSLVYKK